MKLVDMESFIEDLARAAGEVILPFFRTNLSVQDKSGKKAFDPVTEADRAAEAIIRSRILTHFPAHGIVGEEFGSHQKGAEFVWVVDPIDGTRSFVCGIPLWGTLIGLLRNGSPVLGVMHQPYTGELFVGNGARALLKHKGRERPLVTRSNITLDAAYLCTTSPTLFDAVQKPKFDALAERVRLQRFGTDCYAYAMLAAGQIDLVVEAGLQPYDIVGLIPVIEGAGGVVTTWDGKSAAGGGNIVAAGDAQLHAAALEFLN
jgi:histidinol phosphatase-like enzyme (inositol monophosphatase family)